LRIAVARDVDERGAAAVFWRDGRYAPVWKSETFEEPDFGNYCAWASGNFAVP
jgi:hypothetical protein